MKPRGSAWEPLRSPVFRALWLASGTSTIGMWVHDVGAAWLMTSMTTSPLLVSLLQTAASAPMLVMALPAGALADLVDRRRLLIVANLAVASAATLLALASLFGTVSPVLLLAFTFALGLGAAFSNPAWQATLPEVVPRRLVPAATSLNGIVINLARALGPALGGLIVAAAGPPAVFTLNAISTFVVVVVVWRWQGQGDRAAVAPAERMMGAMRAGVRFARFSRELRPVLVRAFAFIVCGGAMWALLPLLARQRLGVDAARYGGLLGALGAGALLASGFLPSWRRRLNVDRLVVVASGAFAVLLVLLATIRSYTIALLVIFALGMAWIAITPTLNVAVIQALPLWVRARGLATYSVVFQGATAVAGILWGTVATVAGVPASLLVAAGGLAAGLLLAPLFPLRRGEDVDLSPAGHWPTIEGLVPHSELETGPVLVSVEYQIDPAKRDEFLEHVYAGRSARRRDGAYAWGIYQDTEDPSKYIEEFLVESWSEHLRQHARVTRQDQVQEALAIAFHIGPQAPRVRHLLYAELNRERNGRLSLPGAP